MEVYDFYYISPIGTLKIRGNEELIFSLDFDEEGENGEHYPASIMNCAAQLDEYFKGERKDFDISFSLEGTEFQRKVWKELTRIPYGSTVSYKYIAENIGNEKAVRAVGMTNSRNPLAIIVPCHRVIGSSGKLTGYAGGLWRKEWLLNHEKEYK